MRRRLPVTPWSCWCPFRAWRNARLRPRHHRPRSPARSRCTRTTADGVHAAGSAKLDEQKNELGGLRTQLGDVTARRDKPRTDVNALIAAFDIEMTD